jgi:hypothetical protein
MEQLEIKHLAPYLPYGLMTDKGKLISIQNDCRNVINPILKFEVINDKYDITEQIIKYPEIEPSKYHYEAELITKVKPILRSISSLIGENCYIDLYEIKEVLAGKTIDDGSLYVSDEGRAYFDGVLKLDIPNLKYEFVEKLFEFHFDVFGLIERGLAIDINTLKQSKTNDN